MNALLERSVRLISTVVSALFYIVFGGVSYVSMKLFSRPEAAGWQPVDFATDVESLGSSY